jgi:hypothetical protein
MAYFTDDIVSQVDKVATIGYLDRRRVGIWNNNRDGDDLRALTGWYWVAKADRNKYGQGLKTPSAAIREAYYELIVHTRAPIADRRVAVRKGA